MSWYWPQLRAKGGLPQEVDEFQQGLVLSAFAAGSRILGQTPCRPDYAKYGASYTPYPVRVAVQTLGGAVMRCILKDDRFVGGMAREAVVLPVLRKLGLAVPEVLAGPVVDPAYPEGGELLVLEELPGEPLAFVGADLEAMDLTRRLLPRAIGRLHALTPGLEAAGVVLPRRTLADELGEIARHAGPWMSQERFARAVEALGPVLRQGQRPLVFSNGDYNVTNFLHQGERLTGWVDFTHACFEDPHVGMGKFVAWGFDRGWATGRKAGLVERYLYAMNVSRREYAPALAVRCLRLLQAECSVTSREDEPYREHGLTVVGECMEVLG